MAVPRPHSSPKAPRDRQWEWSGTDKLDWLIEHGWDAVGNAHAWYDDSTGDRDPPELKTAYKLPHHELIDDKLKVGCGAGVASAMNVVQGGRGGVDIPPDELEDVYDHLTQHYHEVRRRPA